MKTICAIFFALVSGIAQAVVVALVEEPIALATVFQAEVGGISLGFDYRGKLVNLAKEMDLEKHLGTSPQYFLLVDRNPKRQVVSLAFF